MTQESLFKAIGEIDDSFLAQSDKAPKKPLLWLKITAAVASVAVLAIGAWSVWPSPKPPTTDPMLMMPESAFDITPDTSETRVGTTMVVTLLDGTERTVVYYPELTDEFIVTGTPQSNLSDYARAPYPGEVWIDTYAEPVISQDNNGVAVYWMAIYLSDEDGKPVRDADRIRKHADALRKKGYVIYLYEHDEVPVLCGLFSAAQLLSFPSDEQYGYLIDFAYMNRSECILQNNPTQ